MKRNQSLLILRQLGILAVFVFSAGFLCATTIEVTFPHSTVQFCNGLTGGFVWTQDGNVPTTGNVRISLRNEASTTEIMPIALNAPNNGFYPWTVPMDLVRKKYVIRVKLKGVDVKDDSVPFLICPLLKITSPYGTFEETKTYSITWTWQGPVPNSNVKIQFQNTAKTIPWTTIAESAPVNGPCTWTVPGNIPKGIYVMTFDLQNPPTHYSEQFEIILPKPHVPAKVKK